MQRQPETGRVLVHVINYGGQRNNLYEDPAAVHGLRLGVRGVAGPGTALVAGTELAARSRRTRRRGLPLVRPAAGRGLRGDRLSGSPMNNQGKVEDHGMHFPVRNLLRSTVAGLAALALSAGLGLAQDYQEAPMLAELVAQGTLPPVAERLPEAPMVVEPFEGTGEYGGTWRLIMNSPSDVSTPVRTIGYENFTRWKTWMPDQEQADIVPDVVHERRREHRRQRGRLRVHLPPPARHEMVRRRPLYRRRRHVLVRGRLLEYRSVPGEADLVGRQRAPRSSSRRSTTTPSPSSSPGRMRSCCR